MPEPTLVSAPLEPLISPAYSVLDALPTVKVLAPKVTVVPLTPAREPIVSELLKVRLAPEVLKFTAPVSAIAADPKSVVYGKCLDQAGTPNIKNKRYCTSKYHSLCKTRYG